MAGWREWRSREGVLAKSEGRDERVEAALDGRLILCLTRLPLSFTHVLHWLLRAREERRGGGECWRIRASAGRIPRGRS